MKIFLGISSFQMLAMFRRGLFYSYLSIYLKHFLGLSVTATTLFATIPMILNVLSQRYIWGVFSDRYQKRRTFIIWGELLAAVGTVILWYCHLIPGNKIVSGYIIIAGLSVIEIFWSMSNIGWSALISDIYKKGSRLSVMGKLESFGGAGRLIGILSGGLLYDKLGLAYPGWGFHKGILFFLPAAIMVISIFPMLMVPEGGIKQKELEDEISESITYNARIFILFIFSMVFINFGRNSVAIILTQYLTLESGFNLSSLILSHVVNIRSGAIIVTGILSSWLARKFQCNNILLTGCLSAALALLILGITDNIVHICISSFLMGFSEVIVLAASYELASQLIPPEKRATLFSVFNATLFLSWGVGGTLIAGPVTDLLIFFGRSEVFAYKISFLVSAGITVTGIFLLGWLFALLKQSR